MPRVPDFPRRVSVEVTNHCNQRCPSCPRTGFTRPLGFLDPGLFARLMRECARPGTTVWLHFLGEPLLHPRLLDLVREAKDAGVPTLGLSTNAVSLHGDLAEGILASGLDRLECSMDAVDRDSYARIRGRDHFERVERNVRGFLARKRQLGRVAPVTSVQVLRGDGGEEAVRELARRWEPWLGAGDFVMAIEPASFAGAVPGGDAVARATAARTPCAWLYGSVVVLQDGTVTMCGADWDAASPLGSIVDSTLEELWNGPEMARRRALHEAGRWDALSPCATCDDWRLADGSGYRNVSGGQLPRDRDVDAGRAPR